MKKNRLLIISVIVILLLFASVLAVLSGSVKINFKEFTSLFSGQELSKSGYILMHIRIPRVIGAILAGIALAVAGVIIQTILNNPLAGPNIIGVNSGAGFLVVLCAAFLPGYYKLYPFAAFIGAFVTVTLVYFVGKKTNSSKISLVLSGMVINTLLNSATDMMYVLNDDLIISNKMFKIGGLNGINNDVLLTASIAIFICVLIVFALHNELEVLGLGEETAKSLGLSVGLYRFIFLILAAILSGSAISFTGLIGFIGLIVPHIARILVGDECKYLIPCSAFLGALLLVFCDYLSRTLFSPYEIPVGIILSFLGAPFFLWLLASRKRSRRND